MHSVKWADPSSRTGCLPSRRSFLQSAAAAAAVGACDKAAFASLLEQVTPRKQPNIVVILSDDVGYGDVGCYGGVNVSTPHIDGLATGGLRFTNAHTDAATCTPSRYAMLTGEYAWRRDDVQILPGNAKSLIAPGQPTIASVFKSAGYATGLVGKWHLGLGDGSIDWNGEIKPGPRELGFDEAFYFPATADRVPTVYVNDHRVVNLDPADPISVSYKNKVGTDATGREDPELLKMKLSEDDTEHDGTIVDGISRIGFMQGGERARWKDEAMAQTFTGKACDFIRAHKGEKFLLYFTPSDIHVPRAPAAEFAGRSQCGVRCDVITQLDWSVGQVMQTLYDEGLTEDTLVLFTSDNGPVANDGYDDGSLEALGRHRPAGPFRGGKYSVYEGGTIVPFITSWHGTVQPGVSAAMISQVDLLRSLAGVVGQPLPTDVPSDGQNLSAALLGKTQTGREYLIEEGEVLAIRDTQWKLVDRSETPGNHGPRPPGVFGTGARRQAIEHRHMPWSRTSPTAEIELYDLHADPGETLNVAVKHPDIVDRLRTRLRVARKRTSDDPHARSALVKPISRGEL